jgi:peptide deformylase
MSKLNILTIPNKKLREPSREVLVDEVIGMKFQELIEDMSETMKMAEGVGLAAPQVGQNIRLIVVEFPDGPKAFINPVIIKKSWRKVTSEEGCLSVPDKWGLVKRHKTVTVTANDQLGNELKIMARGMLSIVFQHEIDHLDGVLFIDKLCKK